MSFHGGELAPPAHRNHTFNFRIIYIMELICVRKCAKLGLWCTLRHKLSFYTQSCPWRCGQIEPICSQCPIGFGCGPPCWPEVLEWSHRSAPRQSRRARPARTWSDVVQEFFQAAKTACVEDASSSRGAQSAIARRWDCSPVCETFNPLVLRKPGLPWI